MKRHENSNSLWIRAIHFLFFVTICFFASSGKVFSIDWTELSNFNPKTNLAHYLNPEIIEQCSRFDLNTSINLVKIEILTDGTKGGGLLRIYGNEGGASIPVLKRDLIEPIRFTKDETGIQKILIDIGSLKIDTEQLFVSVSDLTNGVFLFTDTYEQNSHCISSNGEIFCTQIMMKSDGTYIYGKYNYCINLIVEENVNEETPLFKDISDEIGIIDTNLQNNSLSVGDYNQDGYLDILVGGKLYKNSGGTTFEDVTSKEGLIGTPQINIFMDLNRDSFSEIIFIGFDSSKTTLQVFLNSGIGFYKGRIIEIPQIINPISFSIGDLNQDEYPDLFITQTTTDGIQSDNLLLINDQNNGFANLSNTFDYRYYQSENNLGTIIFDYNKDRRNDIILMNYDEPDMVFTNLGSMRFSPDKIDIKTKSLQSVSVDVRDINNDGQYELIRTGGIKPDTTCFIQACDKENYDHSKISRILGNTEFSNPDVKFQQGGQACGDLNNDGYLDLVLFSMDICYYPDLLINESGKGFQNATYKSGFFRKQIGRDGVLADFNNDGALDIVAVTNKKLCIYQNAIKGNQNNYVEFDFTKESDFSPYGKELTVYSGDTTYIQRISSGKGILTQEPLRLHFGLGQITKIDSIKIIQNNQTGDYKVYSEVPINTLVNISSLENEPNMINEVIVSPNPFNEVVNFRMRTFLQGDINIKIYTIDGVCIFTQKAYKSFPGEMLLQWNIRNQNGFVIANGVYQYEISIGTNIFYGKIIKID